MPVHKILKATVLSRTNLSHAPVKLRTLTPPTPVQKLVIYFSFFLSPFVFCYLKVFVIFNLHLPVSFRIYFGIFFLLLASLQRILKQVQDDSRWTVGWRTFGPTLRTDAFHINFLPRTFLREGGLATKSTSTQKLFIIHTTTKNLWLTDASILGAGEKLPHKTPPYFFLGK